jgi:hypothetical protein
MQVMKLPLRSAHSICSDFFSHSGAHISRFATKDAMISHKLTLKELSRIYNCGACHQNVKFGEIWPITRLWRLSPKWGRIVARENVIDWYLGGTYNLPIPHPYSGISVDS